MKDLFAGLRVLVTEDAPRDEVLVTRPERLDLEITDRGVRLTLHHRVLTQLRIGKGGEDVDQR